MSDAMITADTSQPDRVEWVCSEHGVRRTVKVRVWHRGDPLGSPEFCDECGASCAWRSCG